MLSHILVSLIRAGARQVPDLSILVDAIPSRQPKHKKLILELFIILDSKNLVIIVTEKEEKICPFLSAASGTELYLCDSACMFYDNGKCIIVEGLKSISRLAEILESYFKKRGGSQG